MTNLLIAEDQVWTRKGIIEMIDFDLLDIANVYEAENGIEALDMLELGGIDVLITDIRMPGVDGLALSRIVMEQYPHIKVIIVTGHDEFRYAQQAIQYNVKEFLLKPIQPAALNYALEKILGEFHVSKERETQFFRMVMRQLFEGISINEVEPLGEFSDLFGPGFKRIVRIQGSNAESTQAFVRRLDMEGTNDIHIICLALEDVWCLMVSSDNIDAWAEFRSYVTSAFDTERCDAIRIGIGSEYVDLNHTWISELESMLSLLISPEETQVCEYDAVHSPEADAPELQQLWDCFERQDLPGMNRGLLAWFNEQLPNPQIRQRCFQWAQFALSRFKQSESPFHDSFMMKRLQYLVRMSAHHSTPELVQWIRETCRQINVLHTHHERKSEQLIAWCHAYIVSNLENNISLNRLSEQIHFSPSHLSNLFKQVTGQTYIEFVTALKMDRAKTYLKETNNTVHEIACTLGYEDARYFSKLFRRVTGMTPTAYKLKVSKENTTWSETK